MALLELFGSVLHIHAPALNGRCGDIGTNEALESKDVVGIYCADWSKRCRRFTRLLADSYKEGISSNMNMEIVFISCDKEFEQYREGFAEVFFYLICIDINEK